MDNPLRTPTALPTPTRGVAATLVVRRTMRVQRLRLAQGGALPDHRFADDVLIVLLRGSALFDIDGRPAAVVAGDIIDLPAGAHHSVDAIEALEMIIFHTPRDAP